MSTSRDPRSDWYDFVPDAVAAAWGAPAEPGSHGPYVFNLTGTQLLRCLERDAGDAGGRLAWSIHHVADPDTIRELLRPHQDSRVRRQALLNTHIPVDGFTSGEFLPHDLSGKETVKWLARTLSSCGELVAPSVLGSPAAVGLLVREWDSVPLWERSIMVSNTLRWLAEAPEREDAYRHELPQGTDLWGDSLQDPAERAYAGAERILSLGLQASWWSRRRVRRRLVDVLRFRNASRLQRRTLANLLPSHEWLIHTPPSDSRNDIDDVELETQLLGVPNAYVKARRPRGGGVPEHDILTGISNGSPAPFGAVLDRLTPSDIDWIADAEQGNGRIDATAWCAAYHPHAFLQIIQQRPDTLSTDGPLMSLILEAGQIAFARDERIDDWRRALLSGPSVPTHIRVPYRWTATWSALVVDALEAHLGDDIHAWNVASELLPEWGGSFKELVDTVLAAAR